MDETVLKVCVEAIAGCCSRGQQCRCLHPTDPKGAERERVRKETDEVCPDHLADGCRNPICELLHVRGVHPSARRRRTVADTRPMRAVNRLRGKVRALALSRGGTSYVQEDRLLEVLARAANEVEEMLAEEPEPRSARG